MQLPQDTLIAPAKLTRYLLVWQPQNDKSRWLAGAGYDLENWQVLEEDLRNQLLPIEATLVEVTLYGKMYEVRGTLTGPNGVALAVRSFWMTEEETGLTKFVTLYPDREHKR